MDTHSPIKQGDIMNFGFHMPGFLQDAEDSEDKAEELSPALRPGIADVFLDNVF